MGRCEITYRPPVGVLVLAATACTPGDEPSEGLAPSRMTSIGVVDERYQSCNVEMIEVTGGRFWKPYGPEFDSIIRQSASGQAGAPATGPASVDAFSYHHYGASSMRCGIMGMPQTTADSALSEQWLRRTDETLAFHRELRDEFEPGKPFWNTETGETACGGNPWAGTFLGTFRYLDQLGRLARQAVQVVLHNTLIASDYSLLDEHTFTPKPSYWGALLWRKLMGTIVLASGAPIQEGRHVCAHCLRGTPGGVASPVINNDRTRSQTLPLPVAGERYTLASSDLQGRTVSLNGTELTLGAGDDLPVLAGVPTRAGTVEFAPATLTMIALPHAGNGACQ